MQQYVLGCVAGHTIHEWLPVNASAASQLAVYVSCSKSKVLWFLVQQLPCQLKGTSSSACSPETPLLCALSFLTVPAIPLYWLGSIYPIVCRGLISLGSLLCFAKHVVLSLWVQLSLYHVGVSLSIVTVGLFILGLYVLTCITLQ